MQRHEATWRPPTRSFRRRYVLRAGHTATSLKTRVPVTAVCPRDRTSFTIAGTPGGCAPLGCSAGGWRSKRMGIAASVATRSTQPAPECGDKTACPAVLHCAVHVLWDGIVAAIQTLCQHDSSAGRAAKLISGINRDASHTAFFKDRSVNQDVMLADLDLLSADDHCRMAHARQ